MIVQEAMTSPARSVRVDATLTDIARTMEREDVGTVVVEDGDAPIGIITDRDVVVRGLTAERDAHEVRARDVMTENVVTVSKDMPVADAVGVMRDRKIRRVVAIDAGGKARGVLSMGDVVQTDESVERQREALAEVTQGCGC